MISRHDRQFARAWMYLLGRWKNISIESFIYRWVSQLCTKSYIIFNINVTQLYCTWFLSEGNFCKKRLKDRASDARDFVKKRPILNLSSRGSKVGGEAIVDAFISSFLIWIATLKSVFINSKTPKYCNKISAMLNFSINHSKSEKNEVEAGRS